MGRQEPSKGLAPSAVRREQRAKQAKQTLSKTIPALLASDARARKGADSAELIVDPLSTTPKVSKKASAKSKASRESKDAPEDVDIDGYAPAGVLLDKAKKQGPQVTVEMTDTLSAAHRLQQAAPKSKRNIAILNMASPLRPGGGVRQGASSQEEHLCSRTTLLLSLREEWYRLPDVGGIWSPDVLVFRVCDRDLGKTARFYVDVVSAGMMRFPEVQNGAYATDADREMCQRQVKGVVEILRQKGCERVVLGAWGCGAYANPIAEVARAFRRALKGSELKEVVFAITDEAMASAFATALGDGVEIMRNDSPDAGGADVDLRDLWRKNELKAKIAELEAQIEQTKFQSVKDRLASVLQSLKAQEDTTGQESEEEESDGDESLPGGVDISSDH